MTAADLTEQAIRRKQSVTEALPLFDTNPHFSINTNPSLDLTVGRSFSAKFADPGPPLARRTDPAVSHQAAEDVRPLRKSKKRTLLAIFAAYPEGLTAEEAVAIAGWTRGWQRVSDLLHEGRLRRTGETRRNASGSEADVLEAVP